MDKANKCLTEALQHLLEGKKQNDAVNGRLIKAENDHKAIKLELDRYKAMAARMEGDCRALRAEYAQHKLDTTNTTNKLQKENTDLRKSKEESIGYRLTRVHELNDQEFAALRTDVKKGLETIQTEEDNRSRCVVCLNKKPNICFIDGCDHLVICDQCEKGLAVKACPRCTTPYNRFKRMRI